MQENNVQTTLETEEATCTQGTSEDPQLQVEQEDIEKALQDAVEGLDELEENTVITKCKWEPQKMTVRILLKRYKDKKLVIPLCQRLYVWNEAMRQSLYGWG